MRTTPVIFIVLAFGVAFALMSGSGIGQAVFGENPGDAKSTSTLEDIGEDADTQEEEGGVSADVAGDNEPTLVGFAISGGQFIIQTIVAVALLPVTLTRLGFPSYFATPVGLLAQTVATIGFYQFLRTGELI
jgi:hypothetical protein